MREENGIEIEMAISPDDLISAYRFVYEQYERKGFVESNPLRLRLRERFEMKGNITTFTAIEDGRIVATISLVEDGEHGIPSDDIFHEIVDERRSSGMVCEVSNMAILPTSRMNFGLLMSMFVKVLERCHEMNLETAFISVTPRHASFFSRVLHFEPIGDPVEYVRGDPVQTMMCDLSLHDLRSMIDGGRGIKGPTPQTQGPL